jgi:TetR/AcrR family transcriptional regulator, transcriptional repressor of aconitase
MTSDDAATIGRQGSYAKGVARRREILDRAIEVFAERGADGTSLRRIAESIGVSHGALLHYFDSREQLLVAVYAHAEAKRLESGFAAAPSGDRADRPDDGEAMELMIEAATANVAVPGLVQLYSTLVAASLEEGSVEGRAFFTERFDSVRADVAERLRRDQSAGRVRADVDADAAAALIVAASDGLQIQWLLDPSVGLESTLRAFGALLQPPN